MPNYLFSCPSCEKEHELFFFPNDDKKGTCDCGTELKRDFRKELLTKQFTPMFQPFKDYETGKWITSKQQVKERIMQKTLEDGAECDLLSLEEGEKLRADFKREQQEKAEKAQDEDLNKFVHKNWNELKSAKMTAEGLEKYNKEMSDKKQCGHIISV